MSNNTDLAMQVPAEQGHNRFWRNTSVAELGDGQTATLAPHTVGHESDEDHDNGFRPPGPGGGSGGRASGSPRRST